MSEHTPGPWAVKYRDTDMPYIVANQGKAWDNPIICTLYEDVTPFDSVTIGPWLEARPNANANARLIAAAPKMLVALQMAEKGLDRAFNGHAHGPVWEGLCAVREVITKLKGETK
jgi:hypothetical protein